MPSCRFLIILTKKGFEVSHVPDLVDECTVPLLKEFDGQKLIFMDERLMKDLVDDEK